MMNNRITGFPPIIWMYWHQGTDQAPFIVKTCIDSWKTQNPGWEVRVLDRETMLPYMEWTFPVLYDPILAIVANSELLRVNLLNRYGGVWADATCLCLQPLDTWIDSALTPGFFAFSNPGRDRMLSSWFLASTPGNPLIQEWKNRSDLYWKTHSFPTSPNPTVQKVTAGLFSGSIRFTQFWFSTVVSRWMRLYPYYWFHYQFERAVSGNRKAGLIWKNRFDFPADIPHYFQINGLYTPVSEDFFSFLSDNKTPVAKLTWKINTRKYKPGVVLYELLELSQKKTVMQTTEIPS